MLVASNVEDVAVRTRDLFASLSEFRVLQAQECGLAWPRTPVDGDAALRTKRWVESGGARAVGEDFLGASPLPARTETEGRYEKDSRPVYRVAGVVVRVICETRFVSFVSGRRWTLSAITQRKTHIRVRFRTLIYSQ